MKLGKRAWWAAGVFFTLFCVPAYYSQVWVIEVWQLLVVGWIPFLVDTLPGVTFRWPAIVEAVAVGAVLGVGVHLFLRWLWPRLRPEAPTWPARWSASLVALLFLLFCATMATVGIGHHVGWLFERREFMVENSWHFSSTVIELRNRQICEQALELAGSGVPDVRIGQGLLKDRHLRELVEQRYVLPLRGPGGETGFLLFPRDPVLREQFGGMHCWKGLQRPTAIPASEVARLLAGGAVATPSPP